MKSYPTPREARGHRTRQTEKLLSCGILIVSPAGILLAHATRTPRWDIPKGKIEPGETPKQAALRECLEETGLDLGAHANEMKDLGAHPYLPKKDLHLFLLELPQPLDLSQCKCTTYIERGPHKDRFLETDAYAWVPKEEVFTKVGKGLMRYLVARGQLSMPRTTFERPARMGRKGPSRR